MSEQKMYRCINRKTNEVRQIAAIIAENPIRMAQIGYEIDEPQCLLEPEESLLPPPAKDNDKVFEKAGGAKCEQCGAIFTPKNKTQKYCAAECRLKANKQTK